MFFTITCITHTYIHVHNFSINVVNCIKERERIANNTPAELWMPHTLIREYAV